MKFNVQNFRAMRMDKIPTFEYQERKEKLVVSKKELTAPAKVQILSCADNVNLIGYF